MAVIRRLETGNTERAPSSGVPSARPPPPPVAGLPLSAAFGVISGAAGGVAMFVSAATLAHLEHRPAGAVHELFRWLTPAIGGLGSGPVLQFITPALVGAIAGLPLGLLTRRLLKLVPRLLFFALFMVAVWILVDALVIPRLAPAMSQRLPFIPLMVGAIAYGVCLAIARPPALR